MTEALSVQFVGLLKHAADELFSHFQHEMYSNFWVIPRDAFQNHIPATVALSRQLDKGTLRYGHSDFLVLIYLVFELGP